MVLERLKLKISERANIYITTKEKEKNKTREKRKTRELKRERKK